MRFDDSLETVLSADMATAFGAQSLWRQLVDLIGRGQVPAHAEAIERLWTIRDRVPAPVRAASARALVFADPPAAIVRLFAEDETEIAAPVLRTARLRPDQWIALLPALSPAKRAVLRHRRDLAPEVGRALASFGAADFVIGADDGIAAAASPERPPEALPADFAPLSPEAPFISLGTATRGLPIVGEALRQADDASAHRSADPAAHGPFQISELVARIAAYQRQRGAPGTRQPTAATLDDAAHADDPASAPGFRFETDAQGVVRWVEGVARGPLIGLSLDLAAPSSGSQVDGVAAGAFRRRSGFANARLLVEGRSDAAGQWRITAIPAFDTLTGRFTGYRGTARRPRADERAEPDRPAPGIAPDSLRQLVHELRTPTTAIAGFAEMIEVELLGPVSEPYRDRATLIREQARDLLAAIDDLDLAARIEGHALDLRSGNIALKPLLIRIAEDLAPLAMLRGTILAIDEAMPEIDIAGDDRAVERLIGRLMAALVAAGGSGEQIAVAAARDSDEAVAITYGRPAALAAYTEDALLAIDAESESEADGAPLLGTGFALRLVRNLAVELGGNFTLGAERLTLRLPAAVTQGMGQASTN